ncbi:uncharacterized protein [Periplaneta americana]|uniref:uncharacterized protein isoform X1 n=2 Tax=Periplaneta americana TaxID=6978 RepID=UPI0037E7321B
MVYVYRSAKRLRGSRSQLREMASRGHWMLRQVQEFMDLANHLYTFLAFLSACFLVPGTIVLYGVMNCTRSFWLGVLKRLFPGLEFVRNVTVRTATDTMRNQGIITLLLTVKGRFQPELIKARLQEQIIEKRNKDGKLMFPHLQTSLTTKWGRYAWVKSNSFSLDNHLLVGSGFFRGRIVNDLNIQEYVSDIVSKYLPPELPPWQISLIPSYLGQEERFYFLIRIHHLLLSEEGLGLGDLLLIGPDRPNVFKRRLNEDDENPIEEPLPNSPLTELFPTPVAIPKLYNSIRDVISNGWNQLVSLYDPVENPEILKSSPGIQVCAAVTFITGVSILKELWSLTRKDMSVFKKIININPTITTEVERRQCTPQFISSSILNSLSPKQLIVCGFSFFWCISYTCTITVPHIIVCEVRALVLRDKNFGYSKSITEMTFNYCAMIIAAIKEFFNLANIVYTAPRMLIEELVVSHRDPMHQLQTVSLCGRKVVAWTDPIPLDTIRKIGTSIGASTSEIVISAVSGAMREYFRQFGLTVPGSVLATARYFPLESLMQTSRGIDDSPGPPSGRGLLCLALPTSPIYEDGKESVQEIQRILAEARRKQPAIYEASLWQLDGGYITRLLPSLAVRIILNYLSRRYAVTLTEVAPEATDESRKRLIWGQEIESALYWRTPQSNICLALTLMNYGDCVRLAVMSDAMIAPQHSVITTSFMQQVYQLAAQAGVPRDRNGASSSSQVYQPNIPPEPTEHNFSSNTSVSSASEELRRLTTSSPELNASTSSGTSRSVSPESGLCAHTLNEETIFPFTD